MMGNNSRSRFRRSCGYKSRDEQQQREERRQKIKKRGAGEMESSLADVLFLSFIKGVEDQQRRGEEPLFFRGRNREKERNNRKKREKRGGLGGQK